MGGGWWSVAATVVALPSQQGLGGARFDGGRAWHGTGDGVDGVGPRLVIITAAIGLKLATPCSSEKATIRRPNSVLDERIAVSSMLVTSSGAHNVTELDPGQGEVELRRRQGTQFGGRPAAARETRV